MTSTHHGILLHTVFSTKQRRQWISAEWAEDLYSYIGGTLRIHKAVLLSAGGIADHVHLLVKLHPSFAISDTLQLIKANSSRWINETGKVKVRFEWQRGYGAFSVSQSQVAKVRRYIEHQAEQHKTQSFREEYLAILVRHGIEFDPRFVFDDEILT